MEIKENNNEVFFEELRDLLEKTSIARLLQISLNDIIFINCKSKNAIKIRKLIIAKTGKREKFTSTKKMNYIDRKIKALNNSRDVLIIQKMIFDEIQREDAKNEENYKKIFEQIKKIFSKKLRVKMRKENRKRVAEKLENKVEDIKINGESLSEKMKKVYENLLKIPDAIKEMLPDRAFEGDEMKRLRENISSINIKFNEVEAKLEQEEGGFKNEEEFSKKIVAIVINEVWDIFDQTTYGYEEWMQKNNYEKNVIDKKVEEFKAKLAELGGIEEMKIKVGDRYDPDFHYSASMGNDKHLPDHAILEVIEKGLKLSWCDKVLKKAAIEENFNVGHDNFNPRGW